MFTALHWWTPGVAGQWLGGCICVDLIGFRWGPTGPPVLLGRGSPLLSSSSKPPSCFPRRRPFQALINRTQGAELPAVFSGLTHFLFPGSGNSFPWMLGRHGVGVPSPDSCCMSPTVCPHPGLHIHH